MLKPTKPTRRTALITTSAFVAVGLLLPTAALATMNQDLAVPGGAAREADADRTSAVRAAIDASSAKNVILLIGDGMGDSEITIARNYQYGAGGRLPGIDALPLTGQYTTYSLNKDGSPDYVPDSAATASAWSTGTKTYDNAISVDIAGAPQETLLEIAKANGLKTGNISTAELQDATPAAQVAHVAARSCYGPASPSCGADALASGGLGSISEQLLNTRPDVSLGGGSATFAQTAVAGQWAGKTLEAQARERGYQYVTDVTALTAVESASQTAPLLGMFTPGNFPTRFSPSVATIGGASLPPTTCQPNPARLASGLSLASLTNKAISLLDNRKGFFLQVEAASIDKQDHAADACGQIGETIDLDEAVQAALAFAKQDGDTLVLVTADHAHSSQIVDSTPTTSLSTALTTTEGSVLKVSYGTGGPTGIQQHTGSQLRIAGFGPRAANIVGLTDQTDTFFTMANALTLNRDTASFSSRASAKVSSSTVDPGHSITVTAHRFNGDRQVSMALNTGQSLGQLDLIDGRVVSSASAPLTPGDYTVTVTGLQSGKKATATFRVR